MLRVRVVGVCLVLMAAVCLIPRAGHATNFTFIPVDVAYPNASNTTVTGLTRAGTAVGLYLDGGGSDQGFVLPFARRQSEQLDRIRVLLNVNPQAINRDDIVVGSYRAPDHIQGFLYQNGTFMPFNARPERDGFTQALSTDIIGINDAGTVVGFYRSAIDRAFHGFLYKPSTAEFVPFDWPGSMFTALQGISNDGRTLVGFYIDANDHSHALRIDDGQVGEAVLPGLTDPSLVGVTDSGIVAGTTGGPDPGVGFTVLNGIIQVISVPGSTATELFGIRNDGSVYGAYTDAAGVVHGFLGLSDRTPPVATPPGTTDQVAAVAPGTGHHAQAGAVCMPGSRRWACRAPVAP
jgi:hypothetical protein